MDILKAGGGGGTEANEEEEAPEGAARGLERCTIWRKTRPQCKLRCSLPTTAAVVRGEGFRCWRGGRVGGYPAAMHACMRRWRVGTVFSMDVRLGGVVPAGLGVAAGRAALAVVFLATVRVCTSMGVLSLLSRLLLGWVVERVGPACEWKLSFVLLCVCVCD